MEKILLSYQFELAIKKEKKIELKMPTEEIRRTGEKWKFRFRYCFKEPDTAEKKVRHAEFAIITTAIRSSAISYLEKSST